MMRSTDSKPPPEAIKRIERKRRKERNEDLSIRFGYGIMLIGTVTVSVPILWTSTIELVAAVVGIAIIIVGGLLSNPKVFGAVAQRLIDALPGGKN